MNHAELAGKPVFVTGALRGIGRAISVDAATRGASLALFDIVEDGLEETAAACRDAGAPEVTCHAVNVADGESVTAATKAALADHGGCYGVVNNAGITRDALLVRMTDEQIDQVLDVNLKGAMFFTRALLRPLTKARSGSIVNVASVVGIVGAAGQANYAASKAGLIGFTKSMAKELGSRNIRCNAVAPGYVETAMTAVLPDDVKQAMLAQVPLGRAASPQDVASVVTFLLSPRSGYVTGQALLVDGGMA